MGVQEEASQVKEEAAAQKQGVVQLVQPYFKSNTPSRNVLAVFWLLLSILPLLGVGSSKPAFESNSPGRKELFRSILAFTNMHSSSPGVISDSFKNKYMVL